jgi:hypothetical protein
MDISPLPWGLTSSDSTMAWKKANPDTAARFSAALPQHPPAEPQKMFGYPACFVNGNFFVGMHAGDTVVIRLHGWLGEGLPATLRRQGL